MRHKLAAQECLREIKSKKLPIHHLASDWMIEECIANAILAETQRCAERVRMGGVRYAGKNPDIELAQILLCRDAFARQIEDDEFGA